VVLEEVVVLNDIQYVVLLIAVHQVHIVVEKNVVAEMDQHFVLLKQLMEYQK
jgi:hypothetical protein